MRVAIVGLGPWGLASLERLVAVARHSRRALQVHVVEPGSPGSGIFGNDQPDYMPLNTPCGQHVIHPTGEHEPVYVESLYAWASRQGYRWIGPTCQIADDGVEITPNDFLPRRLMGEWLHASYQAICSHLPSWVSVVHHATCAIDIEENDSREIVHLAEGAPLIVDQVILATGHTPDRDASGMLAPYPVCELQHLVRPGEVVAVAGLGLVALDVVASLTVGRGGRFETGGGDLIYRPSGLEPSIYLFSRSGLPYTAKAIGAADPTGEYQPVICTPAAIARLRPTRHGCPPSVQLDFRRDVLPLILAEMEVRFYRQSVLVGGGSAVEADSLTKDLARAWRDGTFEQAVAPYAEHYGCIDVEALVLGEVGSEDFVSAEDYEAWIYDTLRADVAAAQPIRGSVSPIKAATETLRILRDSIRFLVEFQGLALESYLDFQGCLANRMKSAVAGPPARRSAELLALMDAGVVRVPFGPNPEVLRQDESWMIRSACLKQSYEVAVGHVVRGFLADPTISGTSSPLIKRLADRGRIRPLCYGETEVGSIELTAESHPVGSGGEVQDSLWVFGALTEGVRYFTAYVPSPRSRARAFVDAEICAQEILGARPPAMASEAS